MIDYNYVFRELCPWILFTFEVMPSQKWNVVLERYSVSCDYFIVLRYKTMYHKAPLRHGETRVAHVCHKISTYPHYASDNMKSNRIAARPLRHAWEKYLRCRNTKTVKCIGS